MAIRLGTYDEDGNLTSSAMAGDAFKTELEKALDKTGDSMDDGATIELGRDPENDMDAVTLQYLKNNTISNKGGTVDGDINFSSGKLILSSSPDRKDDSQEYQAIPKCYADGNFVQTWGSTMNGSLNFLSGNLTLAHNPTKDMHAATKQYVDAKMYIDTYIGNGGTKTVSLNSKPKAVYIARAVYGETYSTAWNVTIKSMYGGFFVDGDGGMAESVGAIDFVDTGFIVKDHLSMGDNVYAELNNSDTKYNYIAFF